MSRRKKARASNGSGSINELPSGRYRVSIPVGWLESGNVKRISKVFDTHKEADTWRMETILQRDKGTLVIPDGTTINDLIDLWEESNPHWSFGTKRDNAGTLRRHVSPHLGSMKAADVKPAHIQALLNHLQVTPRPPLGPLSASSRHRVLRRLKSLLAFAERLEAVPRNAAAHITLQAPPVQKRATWTEADLAKVLPVLHSRNNVYCRYLIVGLLTGLRKEELKGLRWQDVNLPESSLRVEHVVVTEGQLVAKERTKTDAGRRTVHYDAATQQALIQQLDAQQRDRRQSKIGLVFTGSLGTPLQDKPLKEELAAVADAAGVPRLRLYDTRRTHGSILAARGVNPKAISERLGHTDVGFSMRTYVFSGSEQDVAIAAVMGSIACAQPCAVDSVAAVQEPVAESTRDRN